MEEPIRAWLAALIDGEGSIMLNRLATRLPTGRGIRYRPVVVIAASTDYRLMTAIQQRLTVGQIYEHAVSNTRKSYNPRAARQWTYRLNVTQIWDVLPEVQPWLVLKNEQATLLLEAMTLKRSLTPGQTGFLPQNRDAIVERLDQIYTDIRVLNTRGRKEVTNEYVT